MELITCNIIQDIMTLYVDDMVSEDSKKLVEEHVQKCNYCRHALKKLSAELYGQEEASGSHSIKQMEIGQEKLSGIALNNQAEISAGKLSGIDGLRNFKKFLFRKKIKTILISAIASIIFIIGTEMYMNWKTVYINYEDAGIVFLSENSETVSYKTSIKGNYHSIFSVDMETGIATIHFEQSLWEKYVLRLLYPFDHTHQIIKKDMVEEWYTDSNGEQTILWQATEEEREFYFLPGRDKSMG